MATRRPAIVKELPPIHVVVPDTNILWHSDKSHAVNPEFDEFWQRHCKALKMELLIPEVVVGELNFQQATSGTKVLNKIHESLKELSAVADQKHGSKVTVQSIKDQVAEKIGRWIKSRSATVVRTPTKDVDWPALIQSAIWRTAPFTYDPKNPDNEKGFRDALILETLKSIVGNALPLDKNVVFICKDQLLRNSAIEFFNSKQSVLCFESLKDFEGYIKLTQEKLTNKFVTGIQNRARKRFFTKGDLTCLYTKENVPELIKSKYASELEPPANQSNSLGTLLTFGSNLRNVSWEPIYGMRWIGSTTFEKLQHPRKYFWSTSVTVARRFRQVLESSGPASLEFSDERILLLPVQVKWSATVKTDGRFHDLTINDFVAEEPTFKVATPELINEWGLQPPGNGSS